MKPDSSDFHSIPVLLGPTGVGKTAVGIELARRTGSEIISADSRQVYRYMDIGTAKPSREQRARVRHHLIDLVDPDERFSAGEYGRQAREAVRDLSARKVPALVVGGAGLYLKTLTEGLFDAPEIPADLRKELEAGYREQATPVLHRRLGQVDPRSAARIHVNDRRRIERALGIYDATGTNLSAWFDRPVVTRPLAMHLIGLQRERDALYARINRRVVEMIESGFEEEVRHLLDRGYGDGAHAMSTFGYAEILGFIHGERDLDETVSIIQQHSRQYAKRQLTWFRQIADIRWISVADGEVPEVTCEKIVRESPAQLFKK